MMHRHLIFACLLLSLASSLLSADDSRITLIELKGRPAEEIIPLIKPMLGPDEAVTGNGYQLILRTSPANLQQIQTLLRSIDQPPKRLLISVHMGELHHSEQSSLQAQIHVENNGIRYHSSSSSVSAKNQTYPPQRGNRAEVKIRSTKSLQDAKNKQQVQTLEGSISYIATGKAYPYLQQETYQGPLGRVQSSSVDFIHTQTGFYARARLRGDQVHVEISPRKEHLQTYGPGVISTSSINTTISGPMGVWLTLGESGGTTHLQRNGPVSRKGTHSKDHEQMWLKVELLEP